MGIDNIQFSLGMTRTEWQILNLINGNVAIDKEDLIKLIAPFVDRKSVHEILSKFRMDYLINEDNQELALTQKGSELHSKCFEKQKVFRQSIMSGISEQEYETTILTLEKMVSNMTSNTTTLKLSEQEEIKKTDIISELKKDEESGFVENFNPQNFLKGLLNKYNSPTNIQQASHGK